MDQVLICTDLKICSNEKNVLVSTLLLSAINVMLY